MRPATTATQVSVRCPSVGRMCSELEDVRTTTPSSARICRQAMVRRMNDVKNGAMTQISMSRASGPALKAIV